MLATEKKEVGDHSAYSLYSLLPSSVFLSLPFSVMPLLFPAIPFFLSLSPSACRLSSFLLAISLLFHPSPWHLPLTAPAVLYLWCYLHSSVASLLVMRLKQTMLCLSVATSTPFSSPGACPRAPATPRRLARTQRVAVQTASAAILRPSAVLVTAPPTVTRRLSAGPLRQRSSRGVL